MTWDELEVRDRNYSIRFVRRTLYSLVAYNSCSSYDETHERSEQMCSCNDTRTSSGLSRWLVAISANHWAAPVWPLASAWCIGVFPFSSGLHTSSLQSWIRQFTRWIRQFTRWIRQFTHWWRRSGTQALNQVKYNNDVSAYNMELVC
jgi:hypothetical protein